MRPFLCVRLLAVDVEIIGRSICFRRLTSSLVG